MEPVNLSLAPNDQKANSSELRANADCNANNVHPATGPTHTNITASKGVYNEMSSSPHRDASSVQQTTPTSGIYHQFKVPSSIPIKPPKTINPELKKLMYYRFKTHRRAASSSPRSFDNVKSLLTPRTCSTRRKRQTSTVHSNKTEHIPLQSLGVHQSTTSSAGCNDNTSANEGSRDRLSTSETSLEKVSSLDILSGVASNEQEGIAHSDNNQHTSYKSLGEVFVSAVESELATAASATYTDGVNIPLNLTTVPIVTPEGAVSISEYTTTMDPAMPYPYLPMPYVNGMQPQWMVPTPAGLQGYYIRPPYMVSNPHDPNLNLMNLPYSPQQNMALHPSMHPYLMRPPNYLIPQPGTVAQTATPGPDIVQAALNAALLSNDGTQETAGLTANANVSMPNAFNTQAFVAQSSTMKSNNVVSESSGLNIPNMMMPSGTIPRTVTNISTSIPSFSGSGISSNASVDNVQDSEITSVPASESPTTDNGDIASQNSMMLGRSAAEHRRSNRSNEMIEKQYGPRKTGDDDQMNVQSGLVSQSCPCPNNDLSHLGCKRQINTEIQCKLCGVCVRYNAAWKKHVDEAHWESVEKFFCKECIIPFESKDDFVYHVKKYHPKLLPYKLLPDRHLQPLADSLILYVQRNTFQSPREEASSIVSMYNNPVGSQGQRRTHRINDIDCPTHSKALKYCEENESCSDELDFTSKVETITPPSTKLLSVSPPQVLSSLGFPNEMLGQQCVNTIGVDRNICALINDQVRTDSVCQTQVSRGIGSKLSQKQMFVESAISTSNSQEFQSKTVVQSSPQHATVNLNTAVHTPQNAMIPTNQRGDVLPIRYQTPALAELDEPQIHNQSTVSSGLSIADISRMIQSQAPVMSIKETQNKLSNDSTLEQQCLPGIQKPPQNSTVQLPLDVKKSDIGMTQTTEKHLLAKPPEMVSPDSNEEIRHANNVIAFYSNMNRPTLTDNACHKRSDKIKDAMDTPSLVHFNNAPPRLQKQEELFQKKDMVEQAEDSEDDLPNLLSIPQSVMDSAFAFEQEVSKINQTNTLANLDRFSNTKFESSINSGHPLSDISFNDAYFGTSRNKDPDTSLEELANLYSILPKPISSTFEESSSSRPSDSENIPLAKPQDPSTTPFSDTAEANMADTAISTILPSTGETTQTSTFDSDSLIKLPELDISEAKELDITQAEKRTKKAPVATSKSEPVVQIESEEFPDICFTVSQIIEVETEYCNAITTNDYASTKSYMNSPGRLMDADISLSEIEQSYKEIEENGGLNVSYLVESSSENPERKGKSPHKQKQKRSPHKIVKHTTEREKVKSSSAPSLDKGEKEHASLKQRKTESQPNKKTSEIQDLFSKKAADDLCQDICKDIHGSDSFGRDPKPIPADGLSEMISQATDNGDEHCNEALENLKTQSKSAKENPKTSHSCAKHANSVCENITKEMDETDSRIDESKISGVHHFDVITATTEKTEEHPRKQNKSIREFSNIFEKLTQSICDNITPQKYGPGLFTHKSKKEEVETFDDVTDVVKPSTDKKEERIDGRLERPEKQNQATKKLRKKLRSLAKPEKQKKKLHHFEGVTGVMKQSTDKKEGHIDASVESLEKQNQSTKTHPKKANSLAKHAQNKGDNITKNSSETGSTSHEFEKRIIDDFDGITEVMQQSIDRKVEHTNVSLENIDAQNRLAKKLRPKAKAFAKHGKQKKKMHHFKGVTEIMKRSKDKEKGHIDASLENLEKQNQSTKTPQKKSNSLAKHAQNECDNITKNSSETGSTSHESDKRKIDTFGGITEVLKQSTARKEDDIDSSLENLETQNQVTKKSPEESFTKHSQDECDNIPQNSYETDLTSHETEEMDDVDGITEVINHSMDRKEKEEHIDASLENLKTQNQSTEKSNAVSKHAQNECDNVTNISNEIDSTNHESKKRKIDDSHSENIDESLESVETQNQSTNDYPKKSITSMKPAQNQCDDITNYGTGSTIHESKKRKIDDVDGATEIMKRSTDQNEENCDANLKILETYSLAKHTQNECDNITSYETGSTSHESKKRKIDDSHSDTEFTNRSMEMNEDGIDADFESIETQNQSTSSFAKHTQNECDNITSHETGSTSHESHKSKIDDSHCDTDFTKIPKEEIDEYIDGSCECGSISYESKTRIDDFDGAIDIMKPSTEIKEENIDASMEIPETQNHFTEISPTKSNPFIMPAKICENISIENTETGSINQFPITRKVDNMDVVKDVSQSTDMEEGYIGESLETVEIQEKRTKKSSEKLFAKHAKSKTRGVNPLIEVGSPKTKLKIRPRMNEITLTSPKQNKKGKKLKVPSPEKHGKLSPFSLEKWQRKRRNRTKLKNRMSETYDITLPDISMPYLQRKAADNVSSRDKEQGKSSHSTTNKLSSNKSKKGHKSNVDDVTWMMNTDESFGDISNMSSVHQHCDIDQNDALQRVKSCYVDLRRLSMPTNTNQSGSDIQNHQEDSMNMDCEMHEKTICENRSPDDKEREDKSQTTQNEWSNKDLTNMQALTDDEFCVSEDNTSPRGGSTTSWNGCMQKIKQKDWGCLLCTYCCDTKEEIDEHIKSTHIALKMFFCPKCPRSDSDYYTVEQHILNDHKDVTAVILSKNCPRPHDLVDSLILSLPNQVKTNSCTMNVLRGSKFTPFIKSSINFTDESKYVCLVCFKRMRSDVLIRRHVAMHWKTALVSSTKNKVKDVLSDAAVLSQLFTVKRGRRRHRIAKRKQPDTSVDSPRIISGTDEDVRSLSSVSNKSSLDLNKRKAPSSTITTPDHHMQSPHWSDAYSASHASSPCLSSHAISPHPSSHASSPRPSSHASSPCPSSHASSPRPSSHASSPCPSSHASSPRPSSHASSPCPSSHASSPRPSSHASSPRPSSHASSPCLSSHASSPRPSRSSHASSPRPSRSSHASSPRPSSHASSPCPSSHASSPRLSSHASSPRPSRSSHASSPRPSSHASSPCPSSHASSPRLSSHASSSRLSSHASSPRPSSHASSPRLSSQDLYKRKAPSSTITTPDHHMQSPHWADADSASNASSPRLSSHASSSRLSSHASSPRLSSHASSPHLSSHASSPQISRSSKVSSSLNNSFSPCTSTTDCQSIDDAFSVVTMEESQGDVYLSRDVRVYSPISPVPSRCSTRSSSTVPYQGNTGAETQANQQKQPYKDCHKSYVGSDLKLSMRPVVVLKNIKS